MEDEFMKCMKRFSKLMKKNLDKDLEEYELTSSQLHILGCLGFSNKEINQREIELMLGLTNPTVTGLLNKLEQKGYIKRVRDEKDNRNKIIVLTDKSLLIKEHITEKKNKLNDVIFNDITDKDLASAINLLKKCMKNMEGMN